MSVNNRRCTKCGKTRADDYRVTFHRLPNPGKGTIEKARAWAKYCWPDEDFSSVEKLKAIHYGNKILCGRHFSGRQFNDVERQKLFKFAVPDVPYPEGEESLVPDNDNMKVEYLSDWETLEDENTNENIKTEASDKSSRLIIKKATAQTGNIVKRLNTQKPLPRSKSKRKSDIINQALSCKQPAIGDTSTFYEMEIDANPIKEKEEIEECDDFEALDDQFDDDYHPSDDDDYHPSDEDDVTDAEGDDCKNVKDETDTQAHFKSIKTLNHKKTLKSGETVKNVESLKCVETLKSVESLKIGEMTKRRDTQKSVESPKSGETLTVKKVSSGRKYGPCRCCLKEDLNTVVDVRSALECLNIEPCFEPRIPALVCAGCSKFLEEAKKFRDMVRASERTLLHRLPHKGPSVSIPEMDYSKNGQVVRGELTIKKIIVPKSSHIKSEPAKAVKGLEQRKVKIYQDSTGHSLPSDDVNESANDDSHLNDNSQLNDDSQMDDEGMDRDNDFGDFSDGDDPDFVVDSWPQKEMQKLTSKDIRAIKAQRAHKKAVMNEIRENLITLIENSNIVPFTSNKDPMLTDQYDCIYNDGGYLDFNELRKHMETEHKEYDFYLRTYIKNVPEGILRCDISRIKCKLCDEQIKDIDALVEHLVNIHGKTYHNIPRDPPHNILGFDLSLDVLKCPVCDKVFSGLRGLLAHMNKHYGSYLCEECGAKFLYAISYRKHKMRHSAVRPSKTIVCDMCGDTVNSSRELWIHKRNTHYDLPKIPIKQKLQTEQKPKKVKETKTKQKSILLEDVHDENKVWECKLCNMEVPTAADLYEHRIQHLRTSKETTHICEICGYTTPHKAYLRRHFKGHWDIKNHECNVCNKRFIRKIDVKLHAQTHLARYQCPLCGTCFMTAVDYKIHLKQEHSDEE